MRSRAPGPLNLPVVGVAPMLRRDPINYLTNLTREYGDLVHFRVLGRDTYLLNHPEYIKEVLVKRQNLFTKTPTLQRAKRLFGEGLLTSEGDFHTRQRRLIQPAFHRDRLRKYGAIMTDYALQARERWTGGGEIDMQREMMRLTLGIVARALFDADVEGDAKPVGEAMSELVRSFRVFLLPFATLLRRLPLPQNRRLDRSVATVKQIVSRIIQEHRREDSHNENLLSALIDVRDEDGSSLSDQQILDEILTLFTAGHETTALALTWTWYLLAHEPECASKFYAEIESVLQGRTPTFEDVPNLVYTDRVVAESMRLRPPIWIIGRLAQQDFELDGISIPKGSICLMSQYLMHHDARFFPAPDRFDTERWSPELRDARPKFCYFPFGGGARACIGDRFAWSELILVLATVAQKWRFQMASDEPIRPVPRLTLQPSAPVRMIAVPR